MEQFHSEITDTGLTPEPGLLGNSIFSVPMSGDNFQLLNMIDSEVGQVAAGAYETIAEAQHSPGYGTSYHLDAQQSPGYGTSYHPEAQQSPGYGTSYHPGAPVGLEALNASSQIVDSVDRDMLAESYQNTAEALNDQVDSGYGEVGGYDSGGDSAAYSE